MGRVYCDVCKKSYENHIIYRKHRCTGGKNSFKCIYCGKDNISRRDSLKRHYLICSAVKEQEVNNSPLKEVVEKLSESGKRRSDTEVHSYRVKRLRAEIDKLKRKLEVLEKIPDQSGDEYSSYEEAEVEQPSTSKGVRLVKKSRGKSYKRRKRDEFLSEKKKMRKILDGIEIREVSDAVRKYYNDGHFSSDGEDFMDEKHSEKNVIKYCSRNIKECELMESCWRTHFSKFKIIPENEELRYSLHIESFVEACKESLKKILLFMLNLKKCLRVRLVVVCKYIDVKSIEMDIDGEEPKWIYGYHSSRFDTFQHSTNIDTFVESHLNLIHKNEEAFSDTGSFWSLLEILRLEVYVCKFSPFRGASFIELPEKIKNYYSLINVKNTEDQFCFLYSILAKLYPVTKGKRDPESYSHLFSKLKYEKFQFPMQVEDIEEFEKLNNLSINVYIFDNEIKSTNPLMYSKRRSNDRKHINLLLIEEGFDQHYVCIQSFSTFMSNQTQISNRRYSYCQCCFINFKERESLLEHLKSGLCGRKKVIMPEKSILKFEDHQKTMKTLYTFYADFEAMLQKPENLTDFESGNTNILNVHVPSMGGYKIIQDESVNSDKNIEDIRMFHGGNCVLDFLLSVKKDAIYIYENHLSKINELKMSEEDEKNFLESTHCGLCKSKFPTYHGKQKGRGKSKHRHHAHVGNFNYICALCQVCNQKLKQPKFIPLLLHNASYDINLIIKYFNNPAFDEDEIKILAKNSQHYISVSIFFKIDDKRKIELRILDSMNFLMSGLEKVSSSLENQDFYIVREAFPDISDENFSLLTRKQIYPYNFFKTLDDYSKPWPDISHFFNDLTSKELDRESFNHGKKVYDMMKCKNMLNYSYVYLKLDILLLASCMQKFRKIAFDNYGLECLHYFGVPSLSMAQMMKSSEAELELLTDPVMHEFLEGSVRGGFCCKMGSESIANFEEMGESYNESQPDKFISYYDCNGLYSYCMEQPLPVGGFKWVDLSSFGSNHEEMLDKVRNFDENSSVSYFLSIDYEYENSDEVHSWFNDYPLLTSKQIPPLGKTQKLLATLLPQKNYVITINMLKFCLEQGLICTKINKILSFNQKPFIKDYVLSNSRKRATATSEYEREVLKLFNNSVFGRLLMSTKNYSDFKLIRHFEMKDGKHINNAQHLFASYRLKNVSVIAKDMAIIEMDKKTVLLNTPQYVGAVILDLAKLEQLRFIYFMKTRIREMQELNKSVSLRILYVDTDSVVFDSVGCRVSDIFKSKKDQESFLDTSKIDPKLLGDKNNNFFPDLNAGVAGFYKNELKNELCVHYIGLAAKAYTFKLLKDDDQSKGIYKRAKGLNRSTIKDFVFSNYKRSLNEIDQNFLKLYSEGKFEEAKNSIKCEYHNQVRIEYKNHKVLTIRQRKKGLISFDDKRVINLDDPTSTLAYGHRDILNKYNLQLDYSKICSPEDAPRYEPNMNVEISELENVFMNLDEFPLFSPQNSDLNLENLENIFLNMQEDMLNLLDLDDDQILNMEKRFITSDDFDLNEINDVDSYFSALNLVF